ncbi:hypothetical protein ACH5RR_009701 [Cinchona calisaya]|uniref:Type 1 phosphatases regulator ypi1 n=1 Tax=Cinchona calisaya TaxID=153742 RepID=A0ABD3AFG0_9GENT
MARSTRQLFPSASFGSLTQTLTLETPSTLPSPSHQPRETLVLKLKPKKKKKKVSWKEGTVDNEFLNKKSSKKCCIFHKEKPFDEDDSDDGENGSKNGKFNKNPGHNHHGRDCDHDDAHGEDCGDAGSSD